MPHLTHIHEAITESLKLRSIGEPVSVRAFLRLSADHGHLVPATVEMIGMTAEWFGTRASSMYARGGDDQGQITTLVEYERGQTALLTAVMLRGNEDAQADVLVVGNHGTLHWEGPANKQNAEPAYEPSERSQDRDAILSALKRSLAIGESTIVGVRDPNGG